VTFHGRREYAGADRCPNRMLRHFLSGLCALALLASVAFAALPVGPEAAQPMTSGSMMPPVTVRDPAGEAVDLLALIRRQPTVLIVYRGGWCPYCNTHLGELATIEPTLTELGYQVVALSPERPETLRKLIAEEPPTPHRLLLSDRDMHASAALGLAYQLTPETLTRYREYGLDLAAVPGDPEQAWLPVPAAFVVDASGMIVFAHADPDHTRRIAAADLLAAARDAVE